MEKLVKELQEFLGRDDSVIQLEACNTILGLTGSSEGRDFIISNFALVACVQRLAVSSRQEVQRPALEILINLSGESGFCEKLCEQESYLAFIQQLMDSLLLKDNLHASPLSQLLSNLTRFSNGAEKAAELLASERNVSQKTLEGLITALNVKDFNKTCSMEYLANFFCNITQTATGRKLMCSSLNYLPKLFQFIGNMESLLRRRGIVGAVRNCCFAREYHKWLLSDEVDVLPRLLLPLAGPEEFDEEDTAKLPEDLQYLSDDKTREPEPEIRKMLVESIHKLCTTMECRMIIKDKNAYVILRELHKWETNEDVETSILDLVQLFIGDDPEKGMENLDEVVIPDDVAAKFNTKRTDIVTDN